MLEQLSANRKQHEKVETDKDMGDILSSVKESFSKPHLICLLISFSSAIQFPKESFITSNFIPVMPNQSGNTEECCIAVSKGGCIQP